MNDNEHISDIDLNKIPGELKPEILQLISEEGMTRLNARKKLAGMGPEILPYLDQLVYSSNRLLRWETVKTIEEIADENSIPVFIKLLEDSDDDIRWIAAEGLIRIGKRSIKPLLGSLIRSGDSFFMKVGAHHILKSLSHGKERDRFRPLLKALRNYSEFDEAVVVESAKLLKNLDQIIDMDENAGKEDDK